MTDQELIQLLHEKPSSEFTLEEFEALRARWTQSPELRQALIERLRLETQLTGALGQVELDVDTILKRAADERRKSPNAQSSFWRWSAVIILFLAIGIGSLFWFSKQPPKNEIADNNASRNTINSDSNSSVTPDEHAVDEPADALVAMAQANPTSNATKPTSDSVPANKVEQLQPEPNEPWSLSLSREVAPWPLNSDKFTRDFKSAGHDELPEVEAKRWFSQVAGQPFNWAQDVYGQQQRRVARFHGFGRLRAPWPNDALLRMTPFEVTDLTIYLWRGPSGVALRFYTRRDPHTWAAFEVTRENSAPKPNRWGLLATDNGSYVRAGSGTFDLRYQDGGITLAKGGIPLMTAPLSGRPDEVFIEGQFRLRGISIHRTAPLMSVPENPHPIIAGGVAASLPWAASVETPAEINLKPDGSAEFRADSRDKIGTAVIPLGKRGLYEVIARVDSADPGTGLFLGDLDGRLLHRVGFFKDSSTSQTTIGVLRPGEVRDQANFDFNAFPPPYHTRAQWIKVVAGLGTVQILVSGDGRHWGHLTEDPARDLPGAVGSVGLFGLQGPNARTLKLASLEIRSLSGITELADPQLVTQAPQFTAEDWRDSARWSHRVVETTPANVDLPRWIAACSVASLSQAPPREIGLQILKRLVSASIQSGMATLQKLQMLDDVSVLTDMWEEGSARLVAEQYDTIADRLAATGDPHPLATIRPAILRSPMWTVSKLRFAWERQVPLDLIRAAYRNDWVDAVRTSQIALFWNASTHPDWVPSERVAELVARQARWVRAVAAENAPQLDDGQAGILPASWRHPLALQWNKEAYNVRAELQAALTGQTYEDACRVVMSINVNDGPGLLPDMDDRQLFVSLPTAVASAMQVHPDFAKLMIEKFGPLGVIRVRQAVQSGDVRGVQSATLQFFGTEAAAEAHQWLGDRDLSAGRFPSAEEHFLLGLAHCLPRQREGLQSRLQLATALNGSTDAAAAPAAIGSLELNGAMISAGDLESLVKSLSDRPSAAKRFHQTAVAVVPPLAPLAYKAEQRATFDGQPGLNPGQFRFGDPFGKQIATVSDDKRIYVSNRMQVNAYGLPGGQQQWAQGLGSEQGEAHAMPFTPMTPLLAGDRLFVRRLTKAGAELACLNVENGNVIWAQRPNLQVLSDPVFWNGSLFALTLGKIDDDLVQVEGTRFDIDTGAATSSQPLFRLRDNNERSNAAQLTISGRLAVCSLAGISACFDGSGEIHWLRRHLWLPKQVDDLADDFRVAAPIIEDGHVIVSVPGVRAISCMDLETGRQIWTRAFADLQGLIAVRRSTVLLDTVSGLTALSLQDGHSIWTRAIDLRLEGFQFSDQHIVVSQRFTESQNKTRPALVWLDVASGRNIATSELMGFERQECQLSSVMYAGGKWWSFGGQGFKEAKRELLELSPVTSRVPGPIMDASNGWLAEIPMSQLIDLALVLPGWRPEANYGPRLNLSNGDVRGETFVISTKLEQNADIRLLRVVDVPMNRKTSLKLRIGNSADRRWSMVVRMGQQQLLEQTVEDAGSSNGWRDVVVDLTPFAGKQIPIQLIGAVPPQQPPCSAYWKEATIVVE